MTTQGEFDFETRGAAGYTWDAKRWGPLRGMSKRGLTAVGAAAYAEHPSTSVLTLSYRLPLHWLDQHGQLRVGGAVRRWRPGFPPPQELFDYLAAGHLLEAHNVMFERLIWLHVCTRLYGWPSLEPYAYQLRCSMAKARVNSLPGALGNLSDVLQLTVRKDADGKRLLDKFSVPRNPTKADPRAWITPEEDPADAERLYGYCDTDVLSEAEASSKMHPMSVDETRFWLIDQEINMRGIAIDRPAVQDCIAVMEQVFTRYEAECVALTGLRPGQRDALLGWLSAQGVHLPDMRADTLRKVLGAEFAALLDRTGEGDEDEPEASDDTPVVTQMPAHARRALELRALTASASVKKLYAMEARCSGDDRLRNLIIHHGARTGRPIGEGPQPLNLPKPGPDLRWCVSDACARPFRPDHATCPWCNAAAAGEAVKWPGRPKGLPATAPEAVDVILEVMALRSLDLVEWFVGDALLAISGCIRGMFVAAPRHELIASDFSSIEAVVLAQLAGERWRIEAFEENKPIYLLGASKITGTPLEAYLAYKEQHGDHHPDRQKIGKVSELACMGAETEVLTIRGYVPITDVRPTDRLWDGRAWVEHAGVIFKGFQDVIRLDGVQITPDHLVNTNGSWHPASTLVSDENTLFRALVTGSENLPSGASTPVRETTRFFRSATAGRPAEPRGRGCGKELSSPVLPARSFARRNTPSATGVTPTSSRTIRTGAAFLIGSRRASLGAEKLEKSNIAIVTIPVAAFESIPLGSTVRSADARSCSISSGFRVGTTRRSNWTASTRTATTSQETFDSYRKSRTPRPNAPSMSCNVASTSLKPVFDIAHAGPRNRFTIRTNSGHLIVHNCGYGGWIGSYKAFGSTEDDQTIKGQILGWRAASPAIVELWGGQYRGLPWDRNRRPELFGIEGHAIAAVQNPGSTYEYRGLGFYMRGAALIIRLLSGRELTYHNARLVPSTKRADELTIIYWTWNSNPKYGARGWGPMETWGSRICENIDQAVAHDIMRFSIETLRAHGYPTVLHVYDEILAEVPAGTANLAEFERLMAIMPPWAVDSETGRPWPIRAAGGWVGKRYRKG